MAAQRSFAIVTGASTGIGFELARQCLDNGFNVLIAADEPEIEQAAARLRQGKGKVEAVQADLSFAADVDRLYAPPYRDVRSMRCWPMRARPRPWVP